MSSYVATNDPRMSNMSFSTQLYIFTGSISATSGCNALSYSQNNVPCFLATKPQTYSWFNTTVAVPITGLGDYNTYIGYGVGNANATSNNAFNTGAGCKVFNSLTSGRENTAYGAFASTSLVSGNYNVAIGRQAMSGGTAYTDCTALGFQAGLVNNGDDNTFIGN